MKRTTSARELFRRPAGKYYAGRRFLVGYPRSDLQMLSAWGVFAETDAREVADTLRAQTKDTPRHGSFADLRLVKHVDSPSLAILASVMTELSDLNRAITTKSAVVHARGVEAMSVAGFWSVVDAGYPVRTFVDPRRALEWLGYDDAQIDADLAPWEALRESLDVGDLTARLREELGEAGAPSTIDEAAARLGVSRRTLQRRLADGQSSFRAETERVRVQRAKTLLADPTRSMKEIAMAVGVASPAAFSALFRRLTGTTPSAWRLALPKDQQHP